MPNTRGPPLATPDGQKSQNRRWIQQIRQHDGRLPGKKGSTSLVGKTDGREISLLLPNLMRKPAEGVQPTKDPNGWGLHKSKYPSKEGINIIDVETPANAYISYFSNDADTAPKNHCPFRGRAKSTAISTPPGAIPVKTGCACLTRPSPPIMDARGKYISVLLTRRIP